MNSASPSRAISSASTTWQPKSLNTPETELFPVATPPVIPTINILLISLKTVQCYPFIHVECIPFMSPPSWKQKTYKQRSEWSAVSHLVTPERFVTHTRLPYRLLYIFRCTFSLAWGQIRTAKIEIVTMSRPSLALTKACFINFCWWWRD